MNNTEQRLGTMENNLPDVLEILGVIRNTMVTKDDLHGVERRLDDKIDHLEEKVDRNHVEINEKVGRNHTEMLEHIDGFIGLSKNQEQETYALAGRVERLEKRVDAIVV